jgi:hypothetical protein
MGHRTVDRRRLLQIGAGALAASVAGCSGDSSDAGDPADDTNGTDTESADDGGDTTADGEDAPTDGEDTSTDDKVEFSDDLTPPQDDGSVTYTDWIPALDGRAGVTYLDRNALETVEGEATFTANSLRDSEDLLLSLSLEGALNGVRTTGTLLQGSGLASIIDPNSSDLSTNVDEILVATDPIVLFGDIDPQEVASALEADDESRGHERTKSHRGFHFYEPPEDAQIRFTFAVGRTAIAVAPQQDSIEAVLDTAAGERSAATAELSAFDWLVQEAGSGVVAFGGYDQNRLAEQAAGQYPELEDANGFLTSQVFDDDGLTAQFAGTYDPLSAERASQLESNLGSLATDPTVSLDGDRVTASATYGYDVFDDL